MDSIEKTRLAYREMMKYADERMTIKLSEIVLRLGQQIGQLLLRKFAYEEAIKQVNDEISENRGASTLMKEIQDYQVELVEARQREKQINDLKEQKSEDSPKEVGEGTVDS